MKQVPKYEIVQQVKRVLVRHAVNLTKLRFSCTQHSAHFLGKLIKDPQGDFTANTVEALAKDLDRLPYNIRLIFELDNWEVHHDVGSWNIMPKKKTGGMTRMNEAYVIDEAENLEDVILELDYD